MNLEIYLFIELEAKPPEKERTPWKLEGLDAQ
jgi:hypothetical protein